MTTSNSSIIKDWLTARPDQAVGYTGTAKQYLADIQKDHPEVTIGAVSGFLFKLAMLEMATMTKVQGRSGQVYTVVKDVSPYTTKNVNSQGSQPGGTKTRGKHNYPIVISKESLAERLLEIASDIDLVTTPLSSFSTEAILNELVRRQKETAKAASEK